MKRRNFLLALITAPFAAALARVPLPQRRWRRIFLSAQELDDLRDVDGFKNIPAREELQRLAAEPINRIEVVERWTREGGIRRVGNGAWERIEPWGVVPFVVPPGVSHWQTTKWISPEERAAAQTFAQGPR